MRIPVMRNTLKNKRKAGKKKCKISYILSFLLIVYDVR